MNISNSNDEPSRDERRETAALLTILALAEREIQERKLTPLEDVVRSLHSRDRCMDR